LNLTPQPLHFELIRLHLTSPREGLLRIRRKRLIQNNISLSQVAMAVDSLMAGAAPSVAQLTNISTSFLPAQVANAANNGFNPTVYAAEVLGLSLSSGAAFNTNFVSLNVTQFSAAVASATGINGRRTRSA